MLELNRFVHSELKPLAEEIEKIREKKSFLWRLWNNEQIESQLDEIKGKITKSMEDFKVSDTSVLHYEHG